MAEGQITHIAKPTAVSHSAALTQWAAYVDIYRQAGWKIVEVPVADDCPDCVFIEDTVVMFGNTAVITAPGTPSRAPEPAAVEKAIREQLPEIKVAKIEGEGTLDGGDVLKVGKDVYVGLGGRTNGEGIRQLRRIVHAEGYTLHAVPVTKALHLSESGWASGWVERWGAGLWGTVAWGRWRREKQ
jgi:dimethylargininase